MRDSYRFTAIFSYDEDGISVAFPDLPGCLTCGRTEDEVIDMAKEALALHLCGMEADGEAIPSPSPITSFSLPFEIDSGTGQ